MVMWSAVWIGQVVKATSNMANNMKRLAATSFNPSLLLQRPSNHFSESWCCRWGPHLQKDRMPGGTQVTREKAQEILWDHFYCQTIETSIERMKKKRGKTMCNSSLACQTLLSRVTWAARASVEADSTKDPQKDVTWERWRTLRLCNSGNIWQFNSAIAQKPAVFCRQQQKTILL